MVMRDVFIFPSHKIQSSSLWKRKMTSKDLREAIAKGNVSGDRRIVVTFPATRDRMPNCISEVSGLVLPLDKRIIAHIQEVVRTGVSTVSEMERHVKQFVKHQLFPDQEMPSRTNRRFFPSKADIHNAMQRGIAKDRLSNIDQENLLLLTKKWKVDNPEDKILFRPLVQKSHENNEMGTNVDWEGQDDEDVRLNKDSRTERKENLLFIHQNLNQQKVLARYGNEISPVEKVFPGCHVYVCDFHSEQAWTRWVRCREHGVSDLQGTLLPYLRRIAQSSSEEQYEENLNILRESEIWTNQKKFANWFTNIWLSCLEDTGEESDDELPEVLGGNTVKNSTDIPADTFEMDAERQLDEGPLEIQGGNSTDTSRMNEGETVIAHQQQGGSQGRSRLSLNRPRLRVHASETDVFHDAGTPTVTFRNNDVEINEFVDLTNNDMSAEVDKGFQSLQGLLNGEQEICINRDTASVERLKLYEDPDLVFKRVHVVFNGEIGDDFDGLTKDLYTSSWRSLFDDFFVGEDSLVQLYRLRKESQSFICIGRILTHTAALLGDIPTRLSRVTLMSLVFGTESIDDEILLQDFRLFLPSEERYLVGKAMSNFKSLSEEERGTMLSIFSSHGLQEMPNENEIKQQVAAKAYNELILKPSPFISLMRKGIPDAQFDVFWGQLTNDLITFIFKRQIPTCMKVVSVMETEGDLTADQDTAFHNLCQFIKSLDADELAEFLLFVTGSTSMPDKLTVTFTHLTGICRRPIAHTCSNLIELPTSYSSYHDLKREFKKVLSSEHSFQMTMF